MSKAEVIWVLVFVVLNILSYLFGLAKDKWGLPKPIAMLLKNKAVMAAIRESVEVGAAMMGKSNEERRVAVAVWVRRELAEVLGTYVPDSAINFLIEKVIADRKVEEAAKLPK